MLVAMIRLPSASLMALVVKFPKFGIVIQQQGAVCCCHSPRAADRCSFSTGVNGRAEYLSKDVPHLFPMLFSFHAHIFYHVLTENSLSWILLLMIVEVFFFPFIPFFLGILRLTYFS